MGYELGDCPTVGGAGGGSQGGDDQLGRSSWRIESGLSRAGRAVGLGRSQGASCLTFWNWNRDRRSAITFCLPGTCVARNRMLWVMEAPTSNRTKVIIRGSRDDCELMM